MMWIIGPRGQWIGHFGLFKAIVYQHTIDGRRWSWTVFDQTSPDLYDHREEVCDACEAYAWIQLHIALRALRSRHPR